MMYKVTIIHANSDSRHDIVENKCSGRHVIKNSLRLASVTGLTAVMSCMWTKYCANKLR